MHALGLTPVAAELRSELGASGLTPPRRAGWEIVARLLELRFNHPAEKDNRELRPSDPATRAEAAYSVAQVLELSEWDLERVADLAEAFDVPVLTEWQRRLLQRGTLRRFSLRLGRHVSGEADPPRRDLPCGIRLLGLRLARVQTRGVG